MRSLLVMTLLCSPLALADVQLKVEAHSLLRLPITSDSLQLERLEIGANGTLLVPASLHEIRVTELVLGPGAYIGIAPGERAFRLEVMHGQVNADSRLSVRGAPGTELKPPTTGRALSLRLADASLAGLVLDARGGAGAPGFRGLDGAAGEAAGCTWGRSGQGHDGQAGSDGSAGAAGAQVRLEVPRDFPLDSFKVLLDGGPGGPAGAAGEAGPGGAGKGCLLYRAEGARAGRPGNPGQPGTAGPAGSLTVVHIE
ncbi:MAG: collagen-like protein [Pseudomonadota bacterium]